MMIHITSEYITLGQLLKLTDYIQSGGQAKCMVKQLNITVNNAKEDRRGRKLYHGDIVVIEGSTYQIVKDR
ncbi:RNA-binding S4 domain-containing protein [Erysipelotrichaceae bacterium OH741_COT-311]|nr:RNA-binding S4 domain-containing protein [Erysipelotrichaceae bacterium OH741_COT-311]